MVALSRPANLTLLPNPLLAWRLLLSIVMVGALPIDISYAEKEIECPKENVGVCVRYKALAAGMDSGDYIVQLSSLRAASQELDPALRALIFGKGLKSTNPQLRTAALRYILASRTALDVTIEPPAHPTPAEEELLKRVGMMTIHAIKVDEKTDEIKAAIMSMGIQGSFILGGFQLSWPYCRIRMNAGEEHVLEGTLRCQSPNAKPVELKARIELG